MANEDNQRANNSLGSSISFEQAERLMALDKQATSNSLEATKQSLTNLLSNADQVIMNIAAMGNQNDGGELAALTKLAELAKADPT